MSEKKDTKPKKRPLMLEKIPIRPAPSIPVKKKIPIRPKKQESKVKSTSEKK